MLKHGEVNPLNVHGLRQLGWCPPHFTSVVFDLTAREADILNWIYENLEGRFYMGYVDVTEDINSGRYVNRKCKISFERAGEASYFSLFLPQLNPTNNF